MWTYYFHFFWVPTKETISDVLSSVADVKLEYLGRILCERLRNHHKDRERHLEAWRLTWLPFISSSCSLTCGLIPCLVPKVSYHRVGLGAGLSSFHPSCVTLGEWLKKLCLCFLTCEMRLLMVLPSRACENLGDYVCSGKKVSIQYTVPSFALASSSTWGWIDR